MPERRGPRLAVVVGGGLGTGVAAAVGGVAGLLYAESRLARRRIPIAVDPAPASDDTRWLATGVSARRPPVRLALLGDSLAAGYGVDDARDTAAVQLALGISAATRRPVHLTNVAVVGAQSDELAPQLSALVLARPDIAVCFVGANDVTARIAPHAAVPHLAEAVRVLVNRGVHVVVGTCPDLGTIRPLQQPLRGYARRLARRMARAQTVAVVEAGGRTVSLGDLLGPLFSSDRGMFAADQFHPSATGYAAAAAAVLPSCLDALGLRTRERSASPFTTRRVKPVERAAAQAAVRPGTEVAAAPAAGRAARRPGAFAQLRRRLPHPRPTLRRLPLRRLSLRALAGRWHDRG